MRNRLEICLCVCALLLALVAIGCSTGVSSSSATSSDAVPSSASSAAAEASSSTSSIEKGTYTVDVSTDSSMFHLNETSDGKGVLTVGDDGMTVHITLVSKKITKLYPGKVEQAKSDEAGIISPTTDKVTYSDGAEEEVYGFDIPVPVLDQEFDVAILGSKGNWYDHKVTVSSPETK